MPGMEIPTPGGTMRKMQFEFTDPAEAQQQPQIPAQPGAMPAGAQGAPPMPEGAQQMQMPMPDQQQAPDPAAGLLGQLHQGGAPDSTMFSNQDLAGLVGDEQDPDMLAGEQMSDQLLDPSMAPYQAQPMQEQLMEAARRRLLGGV
jgi:hypothetical protein